MDSGLLARAGVLVVAGLGACTFDRSVPGGVSINCSGDAECPEGFRCNGQTGLCVATDATDFDAPTATVLRAEPAVVPAGGRFELELQTSEPLAEPPTVTFDDGGQRRQLAFESGDGTVAAPYLMVYPPALDEPQQVEFALDVVMDDLVGNHAEAALGVALSFDFVVPSVVAGSHELRLIPDPSNPLLTVTAVTNGTRIVISFDVDESLAQDPVVELVNTDPMAMVPPVPVPLDGLAGTTYQYELVWADHAVDGVYRVDVTVADFAGNTATYTLAVAGITIDTAAPASPVVDPPNPIVLSRLPWGSETTGGKPWLSIAGPPASVEADATVFVYTGQSASRANRITTIPAAADGSFSAPPAAMGSVRLETPDRGEIYVTAVDAAGNESDAGTGAGLHAARVRDVRWTATLGGKVTGSLLENPHRLFTTPNRSGSRDHPLLTEPVRADSLARVDSSQIDTEGGAAWFPRTGSLSDELWDMQAVYDSARGEIIGYGGTISGGGILNHTWRWLGSGWELLSPTGRPPPLQNTALAFYPVTGWVVLFGGVDISLSDATWAWDGQRWFEIDTNSRPSPRVDANMAYDPVNGALLLFGGYANFDRLDDTWMFDGDDWTQLMPATTPPKRGRAGIGTDEATGQIVMFGGNLYNAMDPFQSDTWLWDGNDWTERCDGVPASDTCTTTPPVDVIMQMFFNPQTRRTHGVWHGNGVVGHHSWNGADWQSEMIPGLSMVNTASQAAAYDRARDRVMLTRVEVAPLTSYAWEHDGTAWQPVVSFALPTTVEYDRLFAYDDLRDEYLVLGSVPGMCPPNCDHLLQIFDGTTYSQDQTLPSSYPPRGIMLFDSARNVTFYHRADADNFSTYEWDGTAWEWRCDTTPMVDTCLFEPTGRSFHAGAFDDDRNVVVMFGGMATFHSNETWEFDSARTDFMAWTEHCTGGGCTPPPAREGHAMAYDSHRQVTVMFGGWNGAMGLLPDLWEWDGNTWTERCEDPMPMEPDYCATVPSPRMLHAMAYDPAARRVVLHAGEHVGLLDDTWTWDGAAWSRLTSPRQPPPRTRHAMLYDPDRQRIQIAGGAPVISPLRSSAEPLEDVWELDIAGQRPGQQLRVAFGASGAPASASVLSAAITWHAGAGPQSSVCPFTPGASLTAWLGDRWAQPNQNAATTPEPLTWSTTNPSRLAELFDGQSRVLTADLSSVSQNDCAGAVVTSDYVEATIHYRLP